MPRAHVRTLAPQPEARRRSTTHNCQTKTAIGESCLQAHSRPPRASVDKDAGPEPRSPLVRLPPATSAYIADVAEVSRPQTDSTQ